MHASPASSAVVHGDRRYARRQQQGPDAPRRSVPVPFGLPGQRTTAPSYRGRCAGAARVGLNVSAACCAPYANCIRSDCIIYSYSLLATKRPTVTCERWRPCGEATTNERVRRGTRERESEKRHGHGRGAIDLEHRSRPWSNNKHWRYYYIYYDRVIPVKPYQK